MFILFFILTIDSKFKLKLKKKKRNIYLKIQKIYFKITRIVM